MPREYDDVFINWLMEFVVCQSTQIRKNDVKMLPCSIDDFPSVNSFKQNHRKLRQWKGKRGNDQIWYRSKLLLSGPCRNIKFLNQIPEMRLQLATTFYVRKVSLVYWMLREKNFWCWSTFFPGEVLINRGVFRSYFQYTYFFSFLEKHWHCKFLILG